MDLKGSLVNTHLKIVPSQLLLEFLTKLKITDEVPQNIVNIIKGKPCRTDVECKDISVHINDHDLLIIKQVKDSLPETVHSKNNEDIDVKSLDENEESVNSDKEQTEEDKDEDKNSGENTEAKNEVSNVFLTTGDIDWIHTYLQSRREKDKSVPYLHILLEGSKLLTPDNEVLKRNPDLEARCVKLRAQQEAREYRKMTKGVDNVRMRFPEDSIAYQLKHMNRQLIAVGQFIISIFAGFMFGFRGVEWMVGNLDFGFRLLLGVMCALIIALAEIYFLAKKLNEEMNIPETVQLGGPPKFAPDVKPIPNQKPHQD